MSKPTKVSRNITIAQGVNDTVEQLASSIKENRSFSNMTEILILEALEARKKKPKKP